MYARRSKNLSRTRPRAGLATLELVLSLPIMLFVMALIVNFGNVATWKIRAQSNTRYAAWRSLQDRTGHLDPNPVSWPQPATLSNSGGQSLADVDQIWNQRPKLITPVTRGPVITDPNQGRSIQVPGRFTMHDTVSVGKGHVQRRLPMLRGILSNDGRYGFTERQSLLDNRWDYRHLSMPANPADRRNVRGDSGNMRRRAKRWYRLDPVFFAEISAEVQQLVQADAQLKSNPTRFDLDPLDRDNELYYIGLRLRDHLPPGPIPATIPEPPTRFSVKDFHPRARRICERDPLVVQRQVVDALLRQIQKLPGRMAGQFASLYQSEINRLQQMMPPPQAEIDRLQRLLDQVQKFQNSLPPPYR